MHFTSSIVCGLALAAQGLAQITLGTAGSFAALAATTITNTGLSVLTGDIGVSPGTAITGFPPGVYSGAKHSADAVSLQAEADAKTAFNALAALPSTKSLQGMDLGAVGTLTPGVYTYSSSGGLTGTLTLDAQGDENALFVFQFGSTLTTASASSVVLINGGKACNVYWQVGSSATLGTTTAFIGNILASASITVTTGVSNQGGLYALTAAITFDTNAIDSQGTCSASPSSSAVSSTSATTSTAVLTSGTSIKTSVPSTVTLPDITVTVTTTITSTSTSTSSKSVCYTKKASSCAATKSKRGNNARKTKTHYHTTTKKEKCTATKTVTTSTKTPPCTSAPKKRWERFE